MAYHQVAASQGYGAGTAFSSAGIEKGLLPGQCARLHRPGDRSENQLLPKSRQLVYRAGPETVGRHASPVPPALSKTVEVGHFAVVRASDGSNVKLLTLRIEACSGDSLPVCPRWRSSTCSRSRGDGASRATR